MIGLVCVATPFPVCLTSIGPHAPGTSASCPSDSAGLFASARDLAEMVGESSAIAIGRLQTVGTRQELVVRQYLKAPFGAPQSVYLCPTEVLTSAKIYIAFLRVRHLDGWEVDRGYFGLMPQGASGAFSPNGAIGDLPEGASISSAEIEERLH